MGNVLLVEHVSLDGVMQAPRAADEDTRDGFARGGWAVPGNDEVMAAEPATGGDSGCWGRAGGCSTTSGPDCGWWRR